MSIEMSAVSNSGSPTTTQPLPSPDPPDSVVSSHNRQFVIVEQEFVPELIGKSYEHYSFAKGIEACFLRLKSDERLDQYNYEDYLEPDIKWELKKLNNNGWNNFEDYLNPVGPQRVTIVHLAAYAGKERDILERVVELYADKPTVFENRINGESTDPWLATDRFGRCALHYAAFEGHGDVVSWIFDKWRSEHPDTPHPQISLKDGFGRTPLNDAVGRSNVDVIELLVNNDAAVNVPYEHGIPWYLPLKEDASFESLSRSITVKVSQRYYNFVKFLLEKRDGQERKLDIDINFAHPKTGWTMLHHAIYLESHEAVKYLVEHGADPNLRRGDCGGTDSKTKSSHLSLDDMMTILNLRQSVASDGLSALQYAAAIGDLESIRILLDNGGNLAKPYPDSRLALAPRGTWRRSWRRFAAANLDRSHNYRTVIGDLRTRLDNLVIMKFLTRVFDAQVKPHGFERYSTMINCKILAPENEPRQMAVISVLIRALQREELRSILKHTLLRIYIEKQWLWFKTVFYSVGILYTFFVIFFSWYTIHLVNNNSDSATPRWLMCISAFFLFCFNFLQILAEPRWHLKQLETWLLFFSLMPAMIVAIYGAVSSNASSPLVLDTLGMVFPLIGMQTMLFISPFVFPWGHYALLISIVLGSVFKVLCIGSFIIAGFSLSFFILFHKNLLFDGLWKTISKTIVMMTGEYDYGDLFTLVSGTNVTEHNPVDSKYEMYDGSHFVTGRIVLILFVIIISIVLMNLMIGLAVDDIQALVDEGEFVRLLKQAVFVAHCEKILLYCTCHFRCFPKKWIRTPEIKHYAIIHPDKSRPIWITEDLAEFFMRMETKRTGRTHTYEMDSDNTQVTLDSLQASLEIIKSQIQQLIQDRNADVK